MDSSTFHNYTRELCWVEMNFYKAWESVWRVSWEAQLVRSYKDTYISWTPWYSIMSTSGGIAGAGAKVTGAVGDVFAKLTFDEEFIDRRQHQKAAPPKLGSKFGGFAKVVMSQRACITQH